MSGMSVWWQQLGLVMAGGALGAALRFMLGDALLRQFGAGFPWGTLPLLRYRAHRLAGVLRILGHPDLADVANDLHELDADDPALWAESARLCSYLQPRIAALADGAITSAAAGTAATAHVPETP